MSEFHIVSDWVEMIAGFFLFVFFFAVSVTIMTTHTKTYLSNKYQMGKNFNLFISPKEIELIKP